jgi:hypothetical protein
MASTCIASLGLIKVTTTYAFPLRGVELDDVYEARMADAGRIDASPRNDSPVSLRDPRKRDFEFLGESHPGQSSQPSALAAGWTSAL